MFGGKYIRKVNERNLNLQIPYRMLFEYSVCFLQKPDSSLSLRYFIFSIIKLGVNSSAVVTCDHWIKDTLFCSTLIRKLSTICFSHKIQPLSAVETTEFQPYYFILFNCTHKYIQFSIRFNE